MIRSGRTDETFETTLSGSQMKIDLDELRAQFDVELAKIEEREAQLQQQLKHLSVVQALAETAPTSDIKGDTSDESRLDMDHFREAILGGKG
jgi:hypothetical protein